MTSSQGDFVKLNKNYNPPSWDYFSCLQVWKININVIIDSLNHHILNKEQSLFYSQLAKTENISTEISERIWNSISENCVSYEVEGEVCIILWNVAQGSGQCFTFEGELRHYLNKTPTYSHL